MTPLHRREVAFVDRADRLYAVSIPRFMDLPTNPMYAAFDQALYRDLSHA